MSFWSWAWDTFSLPSAIIELLLLLVSIVCAFLLWRWKRLDKQMRLLAWLIPIVIVLLVVPWGMVISSYYMYQDQSQTLLGLQNDLEIERNIHRPTITPITPISTTLVSDPIKQAVGVRIDLTFDNIGDRPAYLFEMNVGYAPIEAPELLRTIQLPANPNPFYANAGGLYTPFTTANRISEFGSDYAQGNATLLLYWYIRYTDTSTGNTWYGNQWWFIYPLGAPSLAAAHQDQWSIFEPIVRAKWPYDIVASLKE